MLCDANACARLIPTALRKARLRAGLSEYQAAERIISTPQVIENWENGKNSPQLANLLSVLEAYGLDMCSFGRLLNEVYSEERLEEMEKRLERMAGRLETIEQAATTA